MNDFDCVFSEKEKQFIRLAYARYGLEGAWWRRLPWRPSLDDEVRYFLQDDGLMDTSDTRTLVPKKRRKKKKDTGASRNVLWTDEENKAVREFYPLFGGLWDGWHEHLQPEHCSRRKIASHARQLGVRKQEVWTNTRIQALKKYYPQHGGSWDGWGDIFGGEAPTPASIRTKAAELRIAYTGVRKRGVWR